MKLKVLKSLFLIKRFNYRISLFLFDFNLNNKKNNEIIKVVRNISKRWHSIHEKKTNIVRHKSYQLIENCRIKSFNLIKLSILYELLLFEQILHPI
jgi:hypothetical protein